MNTPLTSLEAVYTLSSMLKDPVMVDTIVSRYNTWEELVAASKADRIFRLGPWAAQLLIEPRPGRLPDFGAGVETSTRYERTYPQRLSDLHDAPVILYRRERLPQGQYVGIGGSFFPSRFGLEVSRAAARVAAKEKKVVVASIDGGSGSAALQEALKHNGKVIAVASGDLRAPSQHTELVGEVLAKGGALISEWGVGESWDEEKKIASLRLVAALGTAVVLTELGTHPAGGAQLARAAIASARYLVVPQPPAEEMIGPAYTGLAVLGKARSFSSKVFGAHPRMLARVASGESPADAVVSNEEDIRQAYAKAF